MAYPPAKTVPPPELIRRGYDRAKGLGHDPVTLRDEHRAFVSKVAGRSEEELPAPLSLPEGAVLVFHPQSMCRAYQPDENKAQRALLRVLQGSAQLFVTHPLLLQTVKAFQEAEYDVRTVTLWIATMTVLPTWSAPGSASPGEEVLSPAEAATLFAARNAGDPAMVYVVAPEGPLHAACTAHGIQVVRDTGI